MNTASNNMSCNRPKLIIIKIGSSLLVDENGQTNKTWLASLAKDIAELKQKGNKCIIVSSGAIALGRNKLGIDKINISLPEKQAAAAAGQAVLINAYESALSPLGINSAQALLTLQDTESRRGWINARDTLLTLLSLGAVPIINENDTVATDEIRYGDNDRLAARVAQMCAADFLVLLSDIDGLYKQDPKINPKAEFIARIENITPEIIKMAGKESGVGSGGMVTKIQAAQIANSAGCVTIITRGLRPNPLKKLFDKNSKTRSSWFLPQTDPLTARKQWIAGTLKPKGEIIIDKGAANALAKASLLAVGIVKINGEFEKGDAVIIIDEAGQKIATGLANYNSDIMQKIKGVQSGAIASIIGYDGGAIIVHRDNMVVYNE